MSPDELLARVLEHRVLDRVERVLELFDLRTIVVDHRIDDPVEEADRPLAHQIRVPRAVLAKRCDGAGMSVVNGHQEVAAEEEIDVVGGEPVLRLPEVDAVQDDIQIPVVGLDFRILHAAHRVLHRERVERERVGQNQRLGNRRRRQVHPHERAGGRIQPAAVDALNLLGPAVPVDEDADHVNSDSRLEAGRSARACAPSLDPFLCQSPTFTDSAACAAASRATGMRYGDALT